MAGSIFSEHFLNLTQEGRGPESQDFADFWEALKQMLMSELKRRGLWTRPPTYLGLTASRWSEGQVLDELAADLYLFLLKRADSLKAHARSKPNIDGLIRLNIRNFLYETQKRHDPLGHRVFARLRTAIRKLEADPSVRIVEGSDRVKNETVLAFGHTPAPQTVPGQELRDPVRRWADDLLPDLVLAGASAKKEIISRLEAAVSVLRDQGVEAFRFKDLADALKSAVRARWAELGEQELGEFAVEDPDEALQTLVRIAHPDVELEEIDAFQALVDCITEILEDLPLDDRTQRYLERLWSFLRSYAGSDDTLWSNRRLARLLKIPRDRLPGLYQQLEAPAEQCHAATFGKRSVREGIEKDDLSGGGNHGA